MQTNATPILPLSHQPPPLTSISAGYSFYSGNFPFSWRPTIGLPRHFPLNILVPPPSLPAQDNLTSSIPLLNMVKEDEVSSSAAEELPTTYKRRDLGIGMTCFTHFGFILKTESLKMKVYLKLAGMNYKSPNVTSTSPIAMPTDPVTLMSPSHHCLPVRDTSNDVNEAAARLLFLSIRWAKSIPSFSHVKFQFIYLFKNKIMFFF